MLEQCGGTGVYYGFQVTKQSTFPAKESLGKDGSSIVVTKQTDGGASAMAQAPEEPAVIRLKPGSSEESTS